MDQPRWNVWLFGINHQQARYLARLHYAHSLFGQSIGGDRHRITGHHVLGGERRKASHMPAYVAVCDNPLQVSLGVGHASHSKTFLADLRQDLRHVRSQRHVRNCIASVHQVAHKAQLRAKFATRVEVAEMFGGKGTVFHQGYGNRVSHRQRQRCRGGRDNAGAAGFAQGRKLQNDVGLFSKAAFGAARDPDERDAEPSRVCDQIGQFRCFARIRDRNDRVIIGDHSKVAVAGFGGGERIVQACLCWPGLPQFFAQYGLIYRYQ